MNLLTDNHNLSIDVCFVSVELDKLFKYGNLKMIIHFNLLQRKRYFFYSFYDHYKNNLIL